jgi:ATP-dependent exoDNAse (exonuclease V) beta subunit
VLDEDAIVLTTWHASKGREWPVVAVCGLDREVKASLPDLGLGYRSFEDLARLLEVARIEYAPAFAAPETEARFLEELEPVARTEARRLLYVALTRARDKLVLEWPGYLAGKDKVTSWSILAEECRLTLAQNALAVGDEKFPCAVIAGGTELPEAPELDTVAPEEELPVIGRRAIEPADVPTGLTPDSRTPSALVLEAPAAASAEVTVVRYGDPLAIEVELSGVALGTFLHRSFEVLGARPDLAGRLPQITGVAVSASGLGQISTAVARFEAWLVETFEPTSVQREWPLLHVDPQGTVVSGMADLIVHTAEGAWIIDHKSDAIEDPVLGFMKYELQLQAYREALAASGVTVAGVAVHWVRRGEVVMKPARVED